MSEFLTAFRSMAAKLESVAGTAETLADADNNVRVNELAITALTVPMDEDPSKIATGDFGLGESIPGPTSAQIGFRVKFHNDTTEPAWTKFIKACGCSGITYSGAYGQGWAIYPSKYQAEQSLTMGVYDLERGTAPSGLFYSFAGCVGNCTMGAEGTGKPINMRYEFTGPLSDITDIAEADIPVLSGVSTTAPDRFLNGSGVVGTVAQCISTMEFNFGNTVSPVECIGTTTGYSKFAITAMEPMLTINPLLQSNAEYDAWGKFIAGTIEAVSISTSDFRLEIPRGQIVSMSVEDADGIIRSTLGIRPLRPSTEGSYNYASWVLYVLK